MAPVKYDKHHQKDDRACGDPFPDTAAIEKLGASGPFRDSLPATRNGHAVGGVDISSVGIIQMPAEAEAEEGEAEAGPAVTRRGFFLLILSILPKFFSMSVFIFFLLKFFTFI